jgi:large subunit ribosomal protein L28
MPMATGLKCNNCGKGIMVGHNVSHAKNRTRKVFKPNLHPARIEVNGAKVRVRLCTKCLRELRGRSTRAKKAAAKAAAAISSSAPAASGLA